MMRLFRIHFSLFAVFLTVYPVRGISNIFKDFSLFDVSVSSNETSAEPANITVLQQDVREICVPPLLMHGSVDPVRSQYKSNDVIRIVCNNGYELENPQSSLLYCSPKGLWKVFTLGESLYIPLPRCIVKERCSSLPPLMQGSMQVQEGGMNGLASELSTTRAVYQCWYGLELEPPESEIRYCVQGKWTGVDPVCVKASCPYPPSVTRGFFIAKGVVNHAYVFGTTVKYYCDTGHHPKGPIVLTCSGKEWVPKELPACLPVETSPNAVSSTQLVARGCPLPPQIPRGRYQILPWNKNFLTSSSSKFWNLNGSSTSPPLVPIYSSAVYNCYRGYVLSSGNSLISCAPGGSWQPIHNAPRCVPYGSHGAEMKEKSMLDEEEDDDQDIQQVPAPILVSFATGIGVLFILILIWIASRWKTTCLRSVQNRPQDPVDSVCHAVSSSTIFPSPTTAPSSARRQQRSLWTWINPPNDRPSAHQLDDDSLPAYDRQLDRDPSTGEQDRMALIAYMSDSNTSSQATLPSYEEAVRAGSTINTGSVYCTWPVAPPSYDSILILDETNTNNNNITTALRQTANPVAEGSSSNASDETAIDSPTTGSSDNLDLDDLEEAENEADVDADAVEGSRETLLLRSSATLDTDAITTFPTRR